MRLPILSYGHDILEKKCPKVEKYYPKLNTLIEDMWETMEKASGCGLAASQINVPLTLFIVDSKTTFDHLEEKEKQKLFEGDEGIKETFINAEITSCSARDWSDTEGCLSIPNHTEKITRPWSITIAYLDENFENRQKEFSGSTARMIQHEFDHTRGVLYLNYLSGVKRKLIEGKLKKISEGKMPAKYPMKYVCSTDSA